MRTTGPRPHKETHTRRQSCSWRIFGSSIDQLPAKLVKAEAKGPRPSRIATIAESPARWSHHLMGALLECFRQYLSRKPAIENRRGEQSCTPRPAPTERIQTACGR